MNTTIYLICLTIIIIIIFHLREDFVYKLLRTRQKKISNYVDEAVCINLKDQKQKYQRFQESTKGKDIDVVRFNAIDTRNENYKKYLKYLSNDGLSQLESTINQGYRDDDAHLTPGAVGCYLSHMNVYMYALAKGYDKILIFEDDVRLPTGFTHRSIKYLENAPKDWDMLLLGWINIGVVEPVNDYWQRVSAFWGLHAYIINKRGMEKVMKYGYPKIKVQIDSMINQHSDEIMVYGVIPQSFVRQNDIHDDHIYETSIQIYPVKQ